MSKTRTASNRRLIIAAAIAFIALSIAGYFVNYRNPEPPAQPPAHVMAVTDCDSLSRLARSYLDAFHVELDRADSDPARREMFLEYAEGTNNRAIELGCP